MNIIENVKTLLELRKCSWNDLFLIREGLLNNNYLFDLLLRKKGSEYSETEFNIVKSWEGKISKDYLVIKQTKNYSIFLETKEELKVYGVLGISEPISEVIFRMNLTMPALIKTVLIPFHNKIISDGMITPYKVSFGAGSRQEIKMNYIKAKTSIGIITSFQQDPNQKLSDSDRLKELLKTKYSRNEFKNEILELRLKSLQLDQLYFQEMGKIYTKVIKENLLKLEITKGWYGIYGGMIIASGINKIQVEQIVNQIVPPEKQNYIYYFKM